MKAAVKIVNPNNDKVLFCKYGKNIFLGLFSLTEAGKIKCGGTGISTNTQSLLERSPLVDSFMKKALSDGFKSEHFDIITKFATEK